MTAPLEQDSYKKICDELLVAHKELLALEKQGKLQEARDNPGLIEGYLTSMRLHVAFLLGFENLLLDQLNEELETHATKRKEEYEAQMARKSAISAAETHARESTRDLEVRYKVTENNLRKVRNVYQRYDGIIMALQSRLKAMNAERINP